MKDKTKGRAILGCVYFAAAGAGYWAGTFSSGSILFNSAVSVLAAVLIIFLGSVLYNNSSVFDPYWSLAPPLMVVFYVAGIIQGGNLQNGHGPGILQVLLNSPRITVLLLLTAAYGVRLTWNFLRGWPGLGHEDWRYADFRANTGKAYWIVSFSGIHLFPAIMVFGGTLSIWVAVVHGHRQTGPLDLAAILVTGYAILLEGVADRQMRGFLAQNRETGKTMDQGLWGLSRHPNYLGEILFWWGLWLFALAANPSFWWVVAGPLAITAMFVFASIPMLEKRMLKRRKDYAAYQKKVSMLIPWKNLNRKKASE